MTNYSILSYMGGCVISAKYEHTGEYLYMGKDGKWGSRDRPEDYFADYAEALKKMEELMKSEKQKYEARVTMVTVIVSGESLTSKGATQIKICPGDPDECLSITQLSGSVYVTPQKWPEIKRQIDKMILECREVKQ